ncbi:hypothetical protein MNBD_UNCLBAC01-819 [hydrothermal vent metagenome]|uniref:Uncharacterized protein n=1 Tax=hydrothermal vent metagenome TaxID=652676 RepID=A0A3B1D3H5_9ZZZZ
MTESKEVLTLEKFHEALHKDIDKPVKDFREEWNQAHRRHIKVHTGAHKAEWAKATVLLNEKVIMVHVNLNFKQNGISDADYEKLKYLTRIGIDKYWSRRIEVAGTSFMVRVKAEHNYQNAIPVDLYVETDKNNYARSMNPAILGIDASFIYNKGYYPNINMADDEFQLVSAHEFGHSVLMHAGGRSLSWGHKGSTGILNQSVKSSTPGYPKKGPVDLMKYYDWDKSKIPVSTENIGFSSYGKGY